MKALFSVASMMIAVVGANTFAAEATPTKAALHVDFNRMIEDNNSAKAEIKKDIDKKASALEQAQLKAEKQKVIDFTDVEVGWGEAPPIVDRRYDSVGEARPYIMNEEDFSSQSGS